MISIGIIEDLPDYRNLLEVLIEHTDGMQIAFSVNSAEDAMLQINKTGCPNICLVDINLPGSSGIELVKWLGIHHPESLFLMCTAYDESDNIFQSLQAGAHGYILKSTSPAGIIEAIIELNTGGSPMSSSISRKVVTAFAQKKTTSCPAVSPREKQILDMLATGLFYKEISNQLEISIQTVKRHCFNIYKKLHVDNRTEAVNKYLGH